MQLTAAHLALLVEAGAARVNRHRMRSHEVSAAILLTLLQTGAYGRQLLRCKLRVQVLIEPSCIAHVLNLIDAADDTGATT